MLIMPYHMAKNPYCESSNKDYLCLSGKGETNGYWRKQKADFAVLNYSYSPRREEDRRLGVDRRWFNYDVHIPVIIGLATSYA